MKKVKIPLDVERVVEYNINAMVDLEERFDVPVTELFNAKRIGMGFMRALLHIGLKHGGMRFSSEVTRAQEEQVGELIQQHWILKGKEMGDLMDFVTEAFKEAGLFTSDEDDESESSESAEGNPTKDAD